MATLALGLLLLLLSACGGESGADCDSLFAELDAFRTAHQEKVIAGVPETDAELQAYQEERGRLIAQYEQAGCGQISGG